MGYSDTDASLFKEEKARKFLKDVMGIDTFQRFIKEGKIEIKSGKYVYELAVHGTVTNKTTNQSYCIILAPGTPDRDDIPLFDIIAIKYAWLKHGVDIVENVANKRGLDYDRYIVDRLVQIQTIPPREYEIGYAGFVRHMDTIGWRREQLCVDESNIHTVGIYNVKANATDVAIEVKAPAGSIISIMGIERIQENSFFHADRLGVKFADNNGNEISPYTCVEIVKDVPNGEQYLFGLEKRYSAISINKNNLYTTTPKKNSEWFVFDNSVVLNSGQSLKIRVINPECDINKEFTRLSLDLDLWIRDCRQYNM